MIDSTKSPLPAWRRYATVVLLTVLIAVAGYVVWTKELHKGQSTAAAVKPPAAAKTLAPKSVGAPSTTTTIPGGIPVSSRDPFAG
jgi:hypothetical protein